MDFLENIWNWVTEHFIVLVALISSLFALYINLSKVIGLKNENENRKREIKSIEQINKSLLQSNTDSIKRIEALEKIKESLDFKNSLDFQKELNQYKVEFQRNNKVKPKLDSHRKSKTLQFGTRIIKTDNVSKNSLFMHEVLKTDSELYSLKIDANVGFLINAPDLIQGTLTYKMDNTEKIDALLDEGINISFIYADSGKIYKFKQDFVLTKTGFNGQSPVFLDKY